MASSCHKIYCRLRSQSRRPATVYRCSIIVVVIIIIIISSRSKSSSSASSSYSRPEGMETATSPTNVPRCGKDVRPTAMRCRPKCLGDRRCRGGKPTQSMHYNACTSVEKLRRVSSEERPAEPGCGGTGDPSCRRRSSSLACVRSLWLPAWSYDTRRIVRCS